MQSNPDHAGRAARRPSHTTQKTTATIAEAGLSLGERLRRDLGEPMGDLAALQQALTALREQPTPGLSPDRLSGLLAAMHEAHDHAVAANLLPSLVESGAASAQLLLAFRSQIAVLRLRFWLVSAVILISGVLLGHLWSQPSFSPLLYTAPPLAVLGVGYAFRSLANGMAEIELACPVHPVELALSRLVVVVGFDILLALLLLPWNTGQVTPFGGTSGSLAAGLILDWLAPLLLSSGASLVASQRSGVLNGSLLGLVVWVAYLALHLLVQQHTLSVSANQGLAVWSLCLIAGLACFVVALFQTRQLTQVPAL